ncbi:Ctr copper transporter [Mycena belliarum]|uniref:Copper transport protein n=1 Tax=Mycena belliarum TaxID=1033014 RepID=A0AAD6UN67_9AGAR|nr:Ctr copper transporter [Mycena belliae]
MESHSSTPSCSMNMLWNTQVVDTCIVFRSWHVSSTATFVASCALVAALGIIYEALRAFQRSLDARIALELVNAPGAIRLSLGNDADADADSQDGCTVARSTVSEGGSMRVPLVHRTLRATLYGAAVFLALFLMLVFMTYNAYLILATVLGAAVGHFLFGGTLNVDGLQGGDSKGVPCGC